MQPIKAQLAKIDRTRFLQLTLLAVGISAVLLAVLGTLMAGAIFGLATLFGTVLLGFGGFFVLAVALGYNPTRDNSCSGC